jgi:hypothetical protein
LREKIRIEEPLVLVVSNTERTCDFYERPDKEP